MVKDQSLLSLADSIQTKADYFSRSRVIRNILNDILDVKNIEGPFFNAEDFISSLKS